MDSPTTIENQTPKDKPVVISSEGTKSASFKFSFVNPKILAAMTVLVLLVSGIGTGVYLIQQPQQTTTQASLTPINLVFQPAEIQAKGDTDFNVDIFVSSNNNQITSTDLLIKYDPGILTLKSITPRQLLPKILIPPVISEGSATISVGTDGTSGVNGSGVVATLLFKANPQSTPTSTEISFDSAGTKINSLNKNSDQSANVLGKTSISITPGVADVPDATSSAEISPDSDQSLKTTLGQASPSAEIKETSQTDFNGDELTNSIDLSIMYSAWGTPETEVQKKADLNSDGKVNGIDYSIFLPKFRL